MPAVQALADLGSIEDDEEFRRFASASIQALIDVVDGKIEFGTNVKGQIVSVTFLANTVTAVPHTLGYVPMGYIPISKSAAGDIFTARSGDWTSSTIYLQCNGAVAAKLFVF